MQPDFGDSVVHTNGVSDNMPDMEMQHTDQMPESQASHTEHEISQHFEGAPELVRKQFFNDRSYMLYNCLTESHK